VPDQAGKQPSTDFHPRASSKSQMVDEMHVGSRRIAYGNPAVAPMARSADKADAVAIDPTSRHRMLSHTWAELNCLASPGSRIEPEARIVLHFL
jgi:hypothetical protein